MELNELLIELKKLGVFLSTDNGELVLKLTKNKVPNSILLELKKYKQQIISILDKDSGKKHDLIYACEKKEYYKLSFAQKRMYLLQQLNLDSTSYNISDVINLGYDANINYVQKNLKKLINRHEIFRTRFKMINDEPAQIVDKDLVINIDQVKILENELHKVKKEFIQPFNLEGEPLIRIKLIETEKKQNFLLIDMHHIICDGGTYDLLKSEFNQLMKNENLAKLSLQYKDYSEWQVNSKRVKEFQKSSYNFWNNKFDNEFNISELVKDYVSAFDENSGRSFVSILDKKTKTQLQNIAIKYETTLFTILYSVFNIILSYFTGSAEIISNIISSGRDNGQLENVAGHFINALISKINVSNLDSFEDFIRTVHSNLLETLKHQNYPVESIFEEKNLQYPDLPFAFNMIHNSQTTMNVGNNRTYGNENESIKFQVELFVTEYEDCLEINWVYASSIYKSSTIENMGKAFSDLLNFLAFSNEEQKNSIKILDLKKDIKQVKLERPKPNIEFEPFRKNEKQDNIIQRFEDIADKYSENTAIDFYGEKRTYSEVKQDIKKTSEIIRYNYFEKGTGIALLFEHGIDMIIGLLGVLKSENYYIPIDPEFPLNRIEYIIKDSSVNVILTNNENIDVANRIYNSLSQKITIINLSDIYSDTFDYNFSSDECQEHKNELAYILYTSGSTGNPKGVIQSQRNVLHFIRTYTNRLHINSHDKLTELSYYGFDAAVMSIYGALLNGASLYIYDMKKEGEKTNLLDWVKKSEITIYHSTPTVYRYFISLFDKESDLNLRLVVLGGEAVLLNDFINFKNFLPDDCIFINGLGPTESTVTVQNFLNKETDQTRETIPVGYPVDETQVFINLDDDKRSLPFIEGEIVFQSEYLANGYLNNVEKTHSSFKVSANNNERCYFTGDIGRMLADGSIEFIGRKDSQIKVRGYRVELGEIESIIDKQKEVYKSVVEYYNINLPEGEIVAFYVVKPGTQLNETELLQKISRQMPDYMIPKRIIQLEKFPLTNTGKIERKQLKEYDINRNSDNSKPQNDIEFNLLNIWSVILNVPKEEIGMNSNFLDLGGHSLKASILISRLFKDFNVKLNIRDIYTSGSIRQISSLIKQSNLQQYYSIPVTEKKEYYVLSAQQKRMFLLQKMNEETTSYNISSLIPISNSINQEKLENILNEIVKRHENFRCSFQLVNNEPVLKTYDELEIKIDIYEVAEGEINKIQKSLIKPFDLGKAPLIRVAYIKTSNKSYLFTDLHHIIGDGTTSEILKREFEQLTNDKKLKKLNLQYHDYSEWQNSNLVKKRLQDQEIYWLNKLKNNIVKLELPTDYERPIIESNKGGFVGVILNEEDTQFLRKLSAQENVTLSMSILSIFSVLISKLSGQNKIIVGLSIAGRNHNDLENIVGMFVNTLPVITELHNDKPLLEFINEVKNSVLELQDNQEYQFNDLVDKLKVKREAGRNPVFDVLVNMLNMSESEYLSVNDDLYVNFEEDNARRFDITLNVKEYKNVIYLSFQYYAEIFKAKTIKRFANYFKQIISTIKHNKNCKISDIDFLNEKAVIEITNRLFSYGDK